MKTTFKALFAPISPNWRPEALAVSGIDRKTHDTYPAPIGQMQAFKEFLAAHSSGRPTFVSDNVAFDWQFVNYYFCLGGLDNPFGFSGRRIGDFYAGLQRDFSAASRWKSLRRTKHSHDPVDDAMGNVEALIAMADQHDVRLPGV